MPAVGATPIDVVREFQRQVTRLEHMEPVVAAFVQYDSRGNRLTVTTLLKEFDPVAEDQLASIEVGLAHAFQDFAFDFVTIHLQGRDPALFRPAESSNALLVVDRMGRNRQAELTRAVG